MKLLGWLAWKCPLVILNIRKVDENPVKVYRLVVDMVPIQARSIYILSVMNESIAFCPFHRLRRPSYAAPLTLHHYHYH